MSGNLWMFSDMLDDEDIEMQKHDFITLYQGADYYGLGLKVFTRMAREAGSVYKIGKKVLIRRTIFDEYLRKVYKKELEKKTSDDSGKEFMKRQGTMVTDEDSGRMDIRFGLQGMGMGCNQNSKDDYDVLETCKSKTSFELIFPKDGNKYEIEQKEGLCYE